MMTSTELTRTSKSQPSNNKNPYLNKTSLEYRNKTNNKCNQMKTMTSN